ncbi:MAG TPA: SigB/SigF/SigG family RNA polymerase sigma factor [Candidatus Eremiobacteraceae bacterium]|nr:SigB/SigF/SigG family RNA polymerase sigma factor [Candidatus Eremiobacteraceae bacterium]
MSSRVRTDGAEERFDRDQTREWFSQYAASSDPEIREELVVAHLNLVRYLAVRFANRGESIDDLIQVGTVGLIKAIDRFDNERGVEFTTYATPTIIGEIKRHFRDKGWAVKVPRRLQELNLAVNRAVETLALELGRSVTVSDLATRLEASVEEIIESQELGQAYNVLSLDTELAAEGEARSATLLDYVGAHDEALELFENKANLEAAIHVLDPRERVIVYLRFYENLSQTEIAKRLNVSQMHVSRLQARALAKLKQSLKVDEG